MALGAGDLECGMVFIPYFNECLVGESDVSSGVEFGAFEGLKLVRKSAHWACHGIEGGHLDSCPLSVYHLPTHGHMVWHTVGNTK